MNDRTRSILEAAGVEHAARRPAEVVQLVSKHLTRPSVPEVHPEAPAAAPEIPAGVTVHPEWVAWAMRGAKYLGFAAIIVTLLMVYSGAHRMVAYSSIGKNACAAGPIMIPEYTCEMSAVNCFTDRREILISTLQETARTHNMALMGCDGAKRAF